MKTNNFLKSILLAVAMFFTANLLAQPTLPDDYVTFQKTDEETDTVTVTSRMPYKIDGDPLISTITALSSEYKWAFYSGHNTPATGTPLNWTIYKGTTTDNTAAGAGSDPLGFPNYYTDNEINVVMPGSPGAYSVVVNQRTILNSKPGCKGEDSVAYIQVVAKPTVAWPSEMESLICGSVTDAVKIPLNFTGYGKWIVGYSIEYTPLGSTSGTSAPGISGEIGGNALKAENARSFDLELAASNFSGEGTYKVTITGLTDRISRKSLTDVAMTAGTEFPASTEVYTLYVLPAPTTKKLQHVKNMP